MFRSASSSAYRLDVKYAALALLPALALFGCSSPGEAAGVGDVLAGKGPRVTVIDEVGDPVEGAEVWIVDHRSLRADVAVLASRITGDWVETAKAVAASIETTDANGLVRFPTAPTGGVLVAASKGSYFAALERRQIGSGKFEITLRPRIPYRVHVVDSEGKPAVGVAVSLAIPRGEAIERLPASARTDEDGVAILHEPPPEAFAARRDVDRGTVRLAVARIPAGSQPTAPVDPVGTGEIVLPPCGTVELIASHSQFSQDHWKGVVQLFAAKNGSRSDQTLAARFEGGRVTFKYVEVGIDLRAVAVIVEEDDPARRPVGAFSDRLEPVELPGEVRGRVLLLDKGAMIEGNAVNAKGEPFAGVPLTLMVENDPATTWTIMTDDRGGFRWLVTKTREGLDGALVLLRANGAKGTKTLPNVPLGSTVPLGTIELN